MRAEHLCCIALQTGRVKDQLRVRMFLDQNAVDVNALRLMAEANGLSDRLKKVEALADDGH